MDADSALENAVRQHMRRSESSLSSPSSGSSNEDGITQVKAWNPYGPTRDGLMGRPDVKWWMKKLPSISGKGSVDLCNEI